MDNKLTKKEKAWILYDVGNSAFTMLSCSLIPIWFKALAIGDPARGYLTSDEATAWYSTAIMIVTLIVAFLGPILGTVADGRGLKKPIFTTILAIGIIFCILNGFAPGWVAFMLMYVITKIAYHSSLVFYDSMLVDVTTEDRMDKVSSFGYAWGYIGSCIPFAVALVAYVLAEPTMGINLLDYNLAKIIGFSTTAIWWFLVTIPLLKNYKQTHFEAERKASVGNVFGALFNTAKKIALTDKKVLLFLIAFFFYIDGVGTIIDNCINIGTDLGLNTVGQVIFLLATQVVAWIFSLIFAKLSKKYKTSTIILICITGYFFVCIYALFLTQLYQFGIMAFTVGMFQGSIQSFSRSYYTKIIPANNSGEYFGIYDIFSKGASFLGSGVIAAVKFAGGSVNLAVALLAFFFLFGFIFFRACDKVPAKSEA